MVWERIKIRLYPKIRYISSPLALKTTFSLVNTILNFDRFNRKPKNVP